MLTLGELTLSHFAPHLGSTFTCELDDAHEIGLTLISATSLADSRGSHSRPREPFSLVFTGPPNVALRQRIHPLRHSQLGLLEIFLVPVGIDAAGRRYEAVFT